MCAKCFAIVLTELCRSNPRAMLALCPAGVMLFSTFSPEQVREAFAAAGLGVCVVDQERPTEISGQAIRAVDRKVFVYAAAGDGSC